MKNILPTWKLFLTAGSFLFFLGAFQSSTIAWVHGGVSYFFPNGIAVTQNSSSGVNYGAGTENGSTNSFIWSALSTYTSGSTLQNPATGICSDVTICFVDAYAVGRDTVDASAASNGFFGHFFSLNSGGTGTKGGHHAALFQFQLVGAPDDTNQFYSAVNTISQASVSAGGTSGAGNGLGHLYGTNPYARLTSGATNWGQLVGTEINTSVHTGASVDQVIGQQIVQDTLDVVSGNQVDIGISLNNQAIKASVAGWDILFADGSYPGYSSLKTTGTIFKCYLHANSGNCGTIANGFDMTNYTLTGAPILAPLKTPSSSSDTCTQGAQEWDASYVYICTATNTWKRAALSTF
jgi:hypothetical protein